MVRLVARRAAQYLLVIWAALTIAFALPRLAPGEPLDYVLGSDAGTLSIPDRARVLAQYGLDRPVIEQYVRYLGGLASGDLGTSVRTGRPVRDLVLGRVPWTLALAIPTLLLTTLIGVPLGAIAAWRRGRPTDVALTGAALLLTSIPAFWLGLVLVAVFALGLGWVPSITSLPLPADGAGAAIELVRRLVLPVVTLVAGLVGWTFLTTRAAVESTLGQEYLLLARAKGLSPGTILFRHGVRNALLPIVTNAGLSLGLLMSGAVVVETVFGVPGLGSLIYSSVIARDYPTLQGAFIVTVLGVVGANLLADLSYPLLDPRVRPRRRLPAATAPDPQPSGV